MRSTTAFKSASTFTGSGEVSMALSGSFKPWPVRVQTTVSPAAMTPCFFIFMAPARLAALAGSQNTPSLEATSL